MFRKSGFTLIELLIVVAIIAILAAIAVPNFLEAQVRSKIARVRSDMRSFATAIETYQTDYNTPPKDRVEIKSIGGSFAQGLAGLGGVREEENRYSMRVLTTPISYIATIPMDPFIAQAGQAGGVGGSSDTGGLGAGKGRYFTYQSYTLSTVPRSKQVSAYGYRWSLHSLGPSRMNASSGSVNDALLGQWGSNMLPYDSTNGTKSYGQIYRTNKGDKITAP